MRRRPFGARVTALVLSLVLVGGPSLPAARAGTPPEAPPGAALDGDVTAGAEAPGLDASEWQVAMEGSSTAAHPRGAVEALLENPFTDLVYFYKNVNGSLVADEDDAYHVFARRCRVRSTLTENCAAADVVYDHVVFTRTARSDGFFDFDVVGLTVEQPVGTIVPAVAPVNPFGAPDGPGPVVVIDADDPRRDPSALPDLATEIAAATLATTETAPATEVGVVRRFLPPEHVTYPYPYERLAAELDDADSADILVNPVPAGDEGDVRGGHGALDVTQSRSTLLVSGRAARRKPLAADDERAMEIKHVDVAPTVAKVLGVSPNAVARYLNNGSAADNPDAEPARLARQDGKVLTDLLEPKVNTFVVVIDGMLPENVTATQTPNLCNLIGCPGAAAPDATARATVYQEARAGMVSQTNANHTQMLTGAPGAVNGIVANTFYDRTAAAEAPLERPSLIRVATLFDALRANAPELKTAAVLGKAKLRALYDCTTAPGDEGGTCVAGSTDNPESVAVTHVRPDFLRGASENPVLGSDDCPAEPASGSGVALDACVMDIVLKLSATEDPDFTFVNLGNVDALQHVSGPSSPAALAAIVDADAQIGRLVAYLKESGKWQDSVLIVTADHAFSWSGPSPTQRLDLESLFAADATITGTGETFTVVSNGGTAHVYLGSLGVGSTALSASQQTALKRMREIALAQTGVSGAFDRIENALDPGASLGARHPAWGLADPRAGDLVVTALASAPTAGILNPLAAGTGPYEVAAGAGFTLSPFASASGVLQGDHGHPGTRRIPFYVIGGGDHVIDQTIAPTGPIDEGDDTAANPGQAENMDIAPTVAWIYGLDPTTVLPSATGRVLTEAFSGVPTRMIEPHANRAIIFMFDSDNSVRIHDLLADCVRQPDDSFACADPANAPIPGVRSLLFHDGDGRKDIPQGTLTAFGSMAAFPTVTFPNHNVVGSGAYPGHLGLVGNRYYERDVEIERDPIDPMDPRNPLFFFTSQLLRADVETLHEAVHRTFGDWSAANPGGAFTASINEPSARGADFASLETTSSDVAPGTFPLLLANGGDFLQDTTTDCGQENLDGYGQESVLDHLGQAQGRALFTEPSTSGLPAIPGVDPSVNDTTGGAAHPDPKYMIENFTLTDGAGHTFGPHANCTRAAYRDTASRLARVLGALADNSRQTPVGGEPARLGETFIVLTGDHGMENQNPAGKDFANGVFFGELRDADVEFLWQDRNVYLLTMHAELVGSPDGFVPPGATTLTFRITDDDVDAAGARRPIAGASVRVVSGAENLTGTTAADGTVTFTFGQPVSAVALGADKDADPAHGARTAGSTSPDPTTHGQVTKSDFNDLRVTFTTSPVAACGPAPASGCRVPLVAGKASLQVTDEIPDTKDRLQWKWQTGATTTLADFGDPLATTGYALCVYDGAGALRSSAAIPAGGTCNAKSPRPCWRASRSGFRYVDRDLTPAGVQQLNLRAGVAGKAQIGLKAKGPLLQTPDLPIGNLPITVQLVNADGQCWQATYSTTLRNQDDKLKAKSD
jgi:predicted AlkP superfamily pyrophosphatase or phosphodiesterase